MEIQGGSNFGVRQQRTLYESWTAESPHLCLRPIYPVRDQEYQWRGNSEGVETLKWNINSRG